MDKKHRFTLHVNMDDFIPATDEEKSYIVQMRPSTTFFKDGVKRLCRNKVALVSLIVVAIITLSAILIPAFWPYSYDQQLGVRPGKPVDASFNNLAPFEYGKTELKRIEDCLLYTSLVERFIGDPERGDHVARHAAELFFALEDRGLHAAAGQEVGRSDACLLYTSSVTASLPLLSLRDISP